MTGHTHGGLHEQIETVTSALGREPQNIQLLLKRAELRRLDGEFGGALEDCKRAIELDPDYSVTQFSLAKVLKDIGRTTDAKRAIDIFLSEHKEHSEALLIRARIRMTLKLFEPAALDFSQAIAFGNPPQPDDYIDCAAAWHAAGKTEKAIASLDEGILKLGPLASLHLAAIRHELELHRYDDALQRVDLLAAQSPRKESWFLQRAQILETAGRTREAWQSYRDARVAIDALPNRWANTTEVQSMRSTVAAALGRLSNEDNLQQ